VILFIGFMENFVNGKVNLPKSFWLYFFLINLILKQGTKILTSTYGQPPKFIGILLFLAITAYGFFSIVGTWKSATINKEKYKGWATAAKIILSLAFLNEISRLGTLLVFLKDLVN
tara:strand:+ start:1330 stop:1677 length:348 start_codon:yes stop_codon:yes gene_type:complete